MKKQKVPTQKDFERAILSLIKPKRTGEIDEDAANIFFDHIKTDTYNNEIIEAIRNIERDNINEGQTGAINSLLIIFALTAPQKNQEIDKQYFDRHIPNYSQYCAKLFSLLSIEEIEELRIPSLSNLHSPVPTLIDAVKFITQQSTISRESLMVISDKYRDKLMEKSQKNPPEFDDDFFKYFGKYLKIEQTLTDKAFDLSYEEKLIQPPYSFSKSFAQLYLDHERKSFQARKFFEPLLNLKLYNRIPLELSPPITRNLTNPDNFISQQLQFSVTAKTDEEKIEINTKILKFYEKLRKKLLDPKHESKRAESIGLLDKTVENYLFLKQLSEDQELNKKLNNESDFDKFFEYYKTNLNQKYGATIIQNIVSKIASTRLPPPSAQQAPASATPKKKKHL